MQQRLGSSHEDSINADTINPTDTPDEDAPVFANVAVPVHISSTFTYRLTPPMRPFAQPGSRIVVPFGRQFVTGYIVALSTHLGTETSLRESDIKDARDLLDVTPLVTPQLLELTRWVSEYYLAPWGEVIKAALPPGISPMIERFLSITPKGRADIRESPASTTQTLRHRLLQLLDDSGETAFADVSDQFGALQANRLARELERDGLVEVLQRPASEFVRAKYQRRVRLAQSNPAAPTGAEERKLTDGQQRVIDVLKAHESLAFPELLSAAEVSASSVATLQKRKLVEVFEARLRRDPLGHARFEQPEDYVLTESQERVLAEIDQPLRAHVYAPFLLHGVTGSGKTEVYIRAMRVALELGRSALMLVPEIALTPVFSRRLRMHFGDKVAIFHSSLSRGERFDEWTRVRNGEARVVIGTRSAVFAPTKDLGLVIVDEEHESTYRQQDSPHYNARDTAIVRAQKESAVVILGSATPSLETFHNASTGKYRYLELPDRLGNRPMALAEIIDMREVFARDRKPKVFSDELLKSIQQTHENGEQSIILLNRRGYSSFVLCRSCGESIQCPNCDVTLTYHRSEAVIVCHYCDHREPAPQKCPSCEGKYIYYVGEGTEQIEVMLGKLFPSLRIARVDRDTTSRRGTFERSLMDFSDGKIDMLVGTQILAKGHDFPNVTLVGVVSVDAGLALPDFRSAERTFQLLTQVAGRAGRGDRPGRVLIQTYHPYHYALRHGSAQDYSGFYQEEIRHRQNHTYPPFVALASLLVHGTDIVRVRADAVELRKELDRANPDRAARILGPAPAPLARLKGEYRVQLLIKCRNRLQLRKIIDGALRALNERKVNLRSINVEIDPVSIM
ncbi:MAG TPA: primosomal protein N' [Pyrinomonadaceae bacterium]|nr:primosomal protein N' [Pyrinomonadaceae bacterium]